MLHPIRAPHLPAYAPESEPPARPWATDAGELAAPARYRLGDRLQAMLMGWGMFGQQALVLIATWLHLQTRVLTIPARGLAAFLAILIFAALVLRPGRIALNRPVAFFLCFWGAYAMRIFLDAGSEIRALELPTRFTLSFIATMAIGACFLPSLALLVNRCWSSHRGARLLSIGFAGISAFAMVQLYGQHTANFEGRMSAGESVGEYVAVHPLVLGYMGAVLSTFALFYLVCARVGVLARIILCGALGATGVVLLVGSASRGPMIALGVVSLVLIASLTRVLNLTRLLVLGIAAITMVFGLIVYSESTGSSLFKRLFGISSAVESDSQESARLDLYAEALDRFYASPVVGASTTVSKPEGGNTYPHNLIIESLMATGLLGTIPLLLLLGSALRAAWRILTEHRDLAWIPLLFILYLTGGMFSMAIYSNSGLWLSLAATLSCATWLRAEAADSELA